MSRVFLKILLLSIGLGLFGNSHAAEANVVSREYQLETAYLFHFAELAEWPAPATPITICLQGTSPLRAHLPVLEGLQIDDRTVHVMLADLPPIQHCQILFLSDLAGLTPSLLEQAKSRHILLVSDAEDFARKGGMIQFTLRDNKLKLVVNLSSVKEAGLRLSSKLLRMAEILE